MPVSVPENPQFLPQGVLVGTIEKEVDLSTAAASFAVGTRPANSAIASIELTLSGTLSATTAVKFGLGNASNPDAYYLSAGLTTASNVAKFLLDADTNSAADPILISACDTNGAAAGTIGGAGQSIKARITYLYLGGA